MIAKRARLLASLLACAAAPLSAQSLWPRKLDGPAELGLEWVRPTFDGEGQSTFAHGIWILDARVKAGKRLNVVAAFPRFVAGSSGGGSSAGNIYVGVEFTDTTGRPEFTLGLRKGGDRTSFDDPWEVAYGDFDRLEEALPIGTAISGTRHTRPWQGEDSAFAELRFGATVLVAEEGGGAMLFNYGVRIGKDGETVGAGLAWTGRWGIGSGGGSLASTIDQLTLDLSLQRGVIRPSIAVRVPFDENLKEVLDYAVIVGVRVALK